MQRSVLCATLLAVLALSPGTHTALPVARANPNTTSAGHLHDGILDLDLVAELTMWHPDGDSLPGIPVEAFAEPGKPPQVPGPLIRVVQGTEIRMSVRNALAQDTITYSVDIGDARDSVVIPPGNSGSVRVRLTRAGNFFYRATTSTTLGRALRVGGMLAGAVVVDSAGTTRARRDRIFVIQVASDGQIGRTSIPKYERSVWAINDNRGRTLTASMRPSATPCTGASSTSPATDTRCTCTGSTTPSMRLTGHPRACAPWNRHREASVAGGASARWSRDGRELVYVDPYSSELVSVPIIPGAAFTTGVPKRLFSVQQFGPAGASQVDISPDGRRFLFSRAVGAATETRDEVVLVQNFVEELKAKVKVKVK